MWNIFKLSWSWHFHQKPTRFSPNRPTRPIWGNSQSVCLVAEEVYHVPSLCLFFKASHWPSDHMFIWRLQAKWIGPVIFFACCMDTSKGCKHNEVGTSFSSLEAHWSGPIIIFSCGMDTFEGCILQTPPPQGISRYQNIFFCITIRIRWEIWCLPYIRFIEKLQNFLETCIGY